jgi:hypothetical protein
MNNWKTEPNNPQLTVEINPRAAIIKENRISTAGEE